MNEYDALCKAIGTLAEEHAGSSAAGRAPIQTGG